MRSNYIEVPASYTKQQSIAFVSYLTDKERNDVQSVKTYMREWKMTKEQVSKHLEMFEAEMALFNHVGGAE